MLLHAKATKNVVKIFARSSQNLPENFAENFIREHKEFFY